MREFKIFGRLSVGIVADWREWALAYVDGRELWGDAGIQSWMIGPVAVHFDPT